MSQERFFAAYWCHHFSFTPNFPIATKFHIPLKGSSLATAFGLNFIDHFSFTNYFSLTNLELDKWQIERIRQRKRKVEQAPGAQKQTSIPVPPEMCLPTKWPDS
jgi:hypothetical protein